MKTQNEPGRIEDKPENLICWDEVRAEVGTENINSLDVRRDLTSVDLVSERERESLV